MRAFIDTNVIIDVLARREPFYADSRRVLLWCQSGCGCGLVSTLTYANVAYVMRKYAGLEPMLMSINKLHKICETAPMADSTVVYALGSGNSDFEDAMQYESALSAHADVIVTRNPADFNGADIRILSPSEFLKENQI